MRARNIKPGFFKSDELAECKPLARILFQGLWCLADKYGYLKYRPKIIKVECLPYDSCKVEDLLSQLWDKGVIAFYADKNTSQRVFIEIPTFLAHQSPHRNEKSHKIKELLENPETSCKYLKLISPLMNVERGMLNDDIKKDEHSHPDGFDVFWEAYPKKKSKAQALKTWKKIKPSKQLLETMLSTIKQAKTSEDWMKESGKFIPYPATWVNAGGWDDEFTNSSQPPVTKKIKYHPGKLTCSACEFYENVCKERKMTAPDSRVCSAGDRFSEIVN